MRVLLDTQVLLWLQTDPARLGEISDTLAEQRSELFVAAASAWEIAIKYGLGRLPLPEPPIRYVTSRISAIGASPLPIELADASAVADLPPHHSDPFDRLLVAQAHRRELTLVTADASILRYDLRLLRVS